MNNRVSLSEMEELRQDMLLEDWRDEQEEIKMRNDDDFFYDAITDKFEDDVRQLEIDVDNFCMEYDRSSDDWFQLLLEK